MPCGVVAAAMGYYATLILAWRTVNETQAFFAKVASQVRRRESFLQRNPILVWIDQESNGSKNNSLRAVARESYPSPLAGEVR